MDELLAEYWVDRLSTVIWNLHFIIPHDLFLAYKELRNNFFQHFIPTYEAYYNRPYVVQWREKNPQRNQEIENALEPTIRTNISWWDHPYLANRVKKIILKSAWYEEVSDETLATSWSEFIQRKGGNTEKRTWESVTFTENLDTEILEKLYQAYHDIMLANPEMLNSTLLT